MKRKISFVVLLTITVCALLAAPASLADQNRNRRDQNRKQGRPEWGGYIVYVGTVTSVGGNTLEVNGRDTDTQDGRVDGSGTGSGRRTFTVAPLCRITCGRSASGTLADLRKGERVEVSYSVGIDGTYTATSIEPAGPRNQNFHGRDRDKNNRRDDRRNDHRRRKN